MDRIRPPSSFSHLALFLFTAFALAAGPVPQVAAQDYAPGEHYEGNPKGLVFGQLSFFTAGDYFVVSPLVGANYAFTSAFEAGLRFPILITDVDAGPFGGGDRGTVFPGNPYLFASYRLELSRSVMMRIGGGVALPAFQPEPFSDDYAVAALGAAVTAASHGYWNSWMYIPSTLTLVLPRFRLDANFDGAFLAAEAAIGILLEAGEVERDTQAVFQFGGEAGARIGRLLELGGRLQLVAFTDVDDAVQVSMAPFIRFTPPPAFFEAKLLVNLDRPAGFSFDSNRVWGLHFSGGGRF